MPRVGAQLRWPSVTGALWVVVVGYAALIVACGAVVLPMLLLEEAAYRRVRARAAATVLVDAARSERPMVHAGGRTWDELAAAADRAGLS